MRGDVKNHVKKGGWSQKRYQRRRQNGLLHYAKEVAETLDRLVQESGVERVVLFGSQEGRIAKANRGKDPLFMFGALQRQLGHPAVPRAKPKSIEPVIHPVLEQRLQRIEKSLQFLEGEMRGSFDLSKYYVKPQDLGSGNGPP